MRCVRCHATSPRNHHSRNRAFCDGHHCEPRPMSVVWHLPSIPPGSASATTGSGGRVGRGSLVTASPPINRDRACRLPQKRYCGAIFACSSIVGVRVSKGSTTVQTQTANSAIALEPAVDSHSASLAKPQLHRIWPQAMIALGLGLSTAWACLLVYGLAILIERAI